MSEHEHTGSDATAAEGTGESRSATPPVAPPPLAERLARARERRRWNPFYVLSAFSMLGPLGAMALNLSIPRSALRPISVLGDVTLSPFWLATAAAAAIYTMAFLRLAAHVFLPLAVGAGVIAAAGQTPRDAAATLSHHAHDGWQAAHHLAPTTAGEWGAIAIVGAFVLLYAGIHTSLAARPARHAGGALPA